MSVLSLSCRWPCRLSRLFVGGPANATGGLGRGLAGVRAAIRIWPRNGYEADAVAITYSDG